MFAVLVGLRRSVGYPAGVAFSVWALWYGTQRLVLDFLRGIDERPVAGLTGTQLLSVVVVVAGAASLLLIGIRRRGWGDRPGDPPSAVAPLMRPNVSATSTVQPSV